LKTEPHGTARQATFETDKANALGGYEGTTAFRAGAIGIMEQLREGVERLNTAQKQRRYRCAT